MADQSSEGLLSPYLRKKRLQAAAPHLRGRVLDFGCGSGGLASQVEPDLYLGVDMDEVSIQAARQEHPRHAFARGVPPDAGKFDTVVALAVIEHVEAPAAFLRFLSGFLSDSPAARIVITTPHPLVDWVHTFGSRIGLFSRHANEEHQDLLGLTKLRQTGTDASLKLASYRRFLFGANQIATYKESKS
jgi:2-polyprenyl-3-methyl-5-hydroxy-6-metoxy-1,4-benzoquinol methylase